MALRFRPDRRSSDEEGYGDALLGRDVGGRGDNLVAGERLREDAREPFDGGLRLGCGLLGTTTFSTRMTGSAAFGFDFCPKSPMIAGIAGYRREG